MKCVKIGNSILCKSILFIIICSTLVPSVLAQDNIVVSTNRFTILDDPSGWVNAGWRSQTAKGNQILGDQTTIKWYAIVLNSNGNAMHGTTVSTELKFPNGTTYYSTTGITDDNGTVEFVKNLDNLNQRPYYATSTEGYWQIDASATVDSQPISSSANFIYDEIGCGKSGSGCHKSQDWQPSSGASIKNLTDDNIFISDSKNSPYVNSRDKIHGSLNGHGHVDPTDGLQILNSECITCHKSYNGIYVDTSTRQYFEPQYPNGVHNNKVNCTQCHGIFDTSLDTIIYNMPIKTCYDCHPQLNNNLSNMNYVQNANHGYSYNPLDNADIRGHKQNIPCVICHSNGHNITKPYNAPSTSNIYTENDQCWTCHSDRATSHMKITNCVGCHSQDAHNIFVIDISEIGSHSTHIYLERGPNMVCTDCHGSDLDIFKDGMPFSDTSVCNACHSSGGVYDGVNDPIIGAKPNWKNRIYNNSDLKEGKDRWCIGCHDNDPAIVNGETASNKAGDDSTYGYYITGHGKNTNYNRMSWQYISAAGNPGANKSCIECHNASSIHIVSGINPGSYRLKTGYDNDQDNTNCNNCHYQGGSAGADPQFYTNSQDYEISVHKDTNCTQCHDVHGNTTYIAMTKGDKENLCLQCHSGQEGHAINTQFGKDGKTYSLQCTSCHNIHIITGMGSGKSPMSKLSNITEVWGDNSEEKMNSLGGTYRTPTGDMLSGSQLPDYPTFCLDCHSDTGFGTHGSISWGIGEPHGLNSANEPNGYGVCPNWFVCGKAEGWDSDVCTNESKCWPVIPRGRGDQLFSRPAYNHEERIAGANFVLSCSDCHVTHELGIGSKLRSTVNGAPGSTIWNTMCNACHYYYSDWHSDMSCGSASCHEANSLHRIKKNTGSGATRIFNRELVADMRFENNLKDSGSFQMDGRWFGQYAGGGTGSFVSGKVGQAIQVNGNQPVEIGSEDEFWSTDEGEHGTWVYSEMKKNMTLETWIYPTGSQSGGENHIFSKHTYTEGGYASLLQEIDGTLRAALLVSVNGGEVPPNNADCNGLRGAFSSIPIPLNQWSHIAVVFDTDRHDRDINNPSEGRIRIYVNGEDVTTSYPNVNSCYAQPGAGEDTIFPYSDMNIKNESRCYNGQWCASALSIGGVMWGDGNRKGLIGKIDEAKVWNVAKSQSYYDQLVAPKIRKVEGAIGRDSITVTFNDGVYTNPGQSGSLQTSDFTLADIDNTRIILSIDHIAGEKIANITLSSPLDSSNDIDIDTIAANSDSVYDSYNNVATTESVIITCDCPTSQITHATFQLNEPAGNTTVTDESGSVIGTVNSASETLLGDGLYHGDGIDNYIDFENYDTALKVSTLLTIETRIKPTSLEGTGTYIRRIFARDGGGNYQISVWRNNSVFTPYFNAPSGVATIAFWLRPVDNHGGETWKLVITNYTNYPIVSDRWYKVKLVWNSSIVGAIPGSIYVDDQGTDGSDTGQNWEGYVDVTDSGQSQLPPNRRLSEGDIIYSADGDFIIGGNVNTHTNNVFKGLIDWISISVI